MIKINNLDNLYIHQVKQLKLAQSYTQQIGLAFILRACRLKPTRFLLGSKSRKTELYRTWYDEFGNTLNIIGKNISLTYNDLSLPRDNITTDLYYGLSIEQTVKISKVMYCVIGKDEDLLQDCLLIGLLGIDNYLRCYVYLYGEWQAISPLYLGLEALQEIFVCQDLQIFRRAANKKNELPCEETDQWLTCLPPPKALTAQLRHQYEGLFSFLNKE